jgi:hypothetical protein
MNAIVIFIGSLVGIDPWSFYTDRYTDNSDCQNKLGSRGDQNFWSRLVVLYSTRFYLFHVCHLVRFGLNQFIMLL